MTTPRIRPFRIDIPAADVDDLHRRLAQTRWPDDLPDVGWEYGVPVSYLRALADYWNTAFDWRAQEAARNELPQFVIDIDGSTLHFVHVRSPEPDAVPLVLVHGWPFEDFTEMVGPLTDPRAHGMHDVPAFHLVIPTLPGFGFSGPTTRVGEADTVRSAHLVVELMAELGYRHYGTQGGDAGSFIAPHMGRLAPDRVVGVHLNGPLTIPSAGDDGTGYSDEDRKKLAALQDWSAAETSSYASIHATRPATLSPALTDSPVGLLSWVIDVVHSYIDPAKEVPEESMDKDALLTEVSILWFTSTIGSSMRLYKESRQWGVQFESSGVPTGIAVFARDRTIRGLAEKQNNVVHWTEFDHGGHFAAMETPAELVADVQAFFASIL